MTARTVMTQVLGLVFLAGPLLAIRWNLAGRPDRRGRLDPPNRAPTPLWRLEIYSTSDDAVRALVDPADIPFPVREVRSDRRDAVDADPEQAWTLPRAEYDVEVVDPFAEEALRGLLGLEHRVRFVSGDEAMIDRGPIRLRIRAVEHQ